MILTLYFTVSWFRERPTIQPLWQFLTFTENLLIDVSSPKAFSHVWSLCVEEQFYVVAPLVVWLLMRRPAFWKACFVCVAILVGGIVLRGTLWVHVVGPLTTDADSLYPRWYERIYYPTWCRLDGLLGGMMFAAVRVFRPMWWTVLVRRANLTLGVGVAGVAIAIWLFTDETAFLPSVIGFPILSLSMAALVAAGASRESLIGRWAIPGSGAIAAMAYSLYLTHKQTYHLTQVAFGSHLDGHPILAVLGYGGAALVAGGLLYAVAERPALIVRDRILARR